MKSKGRRSSSGCAAKAAQICEGREADDDGEAESVTDSSSS